MDSKFGREFQDYVQRIKAYFEQVFAEGCAVPVPGFGCTLHEMIDEDHLRQLGRYVEHYHAVGLSKAGGFQPDPLIPQGTESHPTLEGLLDYLEHHWLPRLLDSETRGIGLHFDRHTDAPEGTVSFSLGIHLTEDGLEKPDIQNPTEELLRRFEGEFRA